MPDPIAKDTLYIRIGSTFQYAWPLTDGDTGLAADPTGWSARCEIRSAYGGNLITRFHSDASKLWDGTITFDVSANLILGLASAKTGALSPGRGVFDVELLDPSGKPYRVVQGKVNITPEATTDA